MLLVFMNIVGSRNEDNFCPFIFSNIVGVACVF